MSSSLIPAAYLDTIRDREDTVNRSDAQRNSMEAKSVTTKHNNQGKRLINSFLSALSKIGKFISIYVAQFYNAINSSHLPSRNSNIILCR